MEEGSLIYHLPGRDYVFHKGDVGFINTQVLHSTSAYGQPPSIQQEHIFLPNLVASKSGSAIETRYIEPLLKNPQADLIRVPAEHERAERMRAFMRLAFAAYEGRQAGFEIVIRNRMSELWFEMSQVAPEAPNNPRQDDTDRIKAMLRYITDNYMKRVSLDQIAAAAQISAREGTRCFKRQMNTTPVDYLLNYRIDRACALLRDSTLSITDIGINCGFSSPSYFGKVFREKLNQSPREYRLKLKR